MKKKVYFWMAGAVLLFAVLAVAVWMIKHRDAFVSDNGGVGQGTWYQNCKVITHALGGIDEKSYLNCYEGLELSYEKGQRVLEVDFLFTSDRALICRHQWKDDLGQENIGKSAPTLEEFLASPIFGTYTPVTAEDVAAYMSSHKDLYLVTDVKHSVKSTTFEDAIKEFVRLAGEIDASILERVIIQIYCEDDYDKIEEIYPFENYIFTLYKFKDEYKDQYGKIADFCLEKGIPVVTMPAKWVKESTDIKELTENDIKVYVHTVNKQKDAEKLFHMGVSGVYSDYLYDSDF